MPDLLQSWLESTGPMVAVGVLVAIAGTLAILWQIFGAGPRRGRRLHRAERLLEQGDWPQALAIIQQLQDGRVSAFWKHRLETAAANCYRAAADEALAAKNFESALEYSVEAARLTTGKGAEARAQIVEAMLAEVRRLFAASSDNKPIQELIQRTLAVQEGCPEAFFWRGMCQLRDGDLERATSSLEAARGENGAAAGQPDRPRMHIDPPLYLGALLLRQGQAKEALRYLTEANRLDSNCPFVIAQLGTAMVRAGGDAQLAVRALQRALGARGFQIWAQNPQRAWVEGFPDRRSFVRQLAAKHDFSCPLWGSDLKPLFRQADTALGQGLYRLGQYQEASEVFSKLMQESAPSLPVLRGLGLCLAKLGQYDAAFKHLRIAHEMEESKDRLTAGYLALCAANGTPSRPEDKSRNIIWAIQLVANFTAPGDPEWAELLNAIFAEARACQVPITRDDQLNLCEHLLSVNAVTPAAAEAYHHLMATHPEAVRSEYAWLFCRASQIHGTGGEHAPALFARTFAEEREAREFFQQREWDFGGLELTYLERAAAADPGHFPAALGADYPERGERLLFSRSVELEQTGALDKAHALAEVHLKLAPRSTSAHDRLAYLHYRKGDRQQAMDLLNGWYRLAPIDPHPLVRLAVISAEIGDATRCLECLRQALDLTSGRTHADIAFLGARLMLRNSAAARSQENAVEEVTAPQTAANGYAAAIELLEECLRHDPDHVQGLWLLAALRHLNHDDRRLAEQATDMNRPHVQDTRFQFLAAVCQLSARNYSAVVEACQRAMSAGDILHVPVNGAIADGNNKTEPTAANHLSLPAEGAYLAGWAHRLQGDAASAIEALQAAAAASSPSSPHARALLGKIHFELGQYDEAVRWWRALDAKQRAEWKLNETLAGAMFLSALEAFHSGAYEQAAERLREAGRCGLRDRRLGLLLSLCLVKAGQEAMYVGRELVGGEWQ